jgi:hypothetical protein
MTESSTVSDQEIEDLMSLYTKPAKETEITPTETVAPEAEEKTNVSEPVKPTTQPSGDQAAPYGRYASGKKAGQPRPAPKGAAPIQQPTAQAQQPEATLTGDLIDGGLFLTMINLIFPMLIAFANNYFSDDKINPEKLKLTKEQIKDLTPITDQAMKQISLTGNPIVILCIGLCAAFGINLMALKMEQQTKE